MSAPEKSYNFEEIAVELGYQPGDPDQPPVMTDMWPDDRAMAVLDYFNDYVKSGEDIVFNGHPICWAMLALLQKLQKNRTMLYIGHFDRSLELLPMRRVSDPKPNPMKTIEITEQGDDVRIVVTLKSDTNPFQMSFGDVEVREIGSGKNIWLELNGGHFLFVFDMPKTFGGDCKTMYYKDSGKTWYCVASNDPAVKVGDKPEKSPFED